MKGVKHLRRSKPKTRTIYRAGSRYNKEQYDGSYWLGCAMKVTFKCLSAAENYILKHFPEQFTLEPYRCRHCNKWHIGNKKKKR